MGDFKTIDILRPEHGHVPTDPKVIEAWTKLFLAVSVVFGFIGSIIVMMVLGIRNVPSEFWIAFGALGAAFTVIVGYHYGSSSGSAAKQEAINRFADPRPQA